MEILLELVPRNEQYIKEQLRIVEQTIPQITAINFPDLLRFDIRAWEACKIVKDSPLGKIAHIRAIDFNLHEPFPLTDYFYQNNIKRVLVIEGDKPQDMHKKIYPSNSVGLIKKLKSELKDIKVFAAFDPYRNNIRYELEYVKQKIDVGTDGFLSQPFFDIRLLEIYSEYLYELDVYWGVCPVTSDNSRLYWETRNRAIFPKSFEPNLEWNIRFGKQVLNFCNQHRFNLYLMPIKIDIYEYLQALFVDNSDLPGNLF